MKKAKNETISNVGAIHELPREKELPEGSSWRTDILGFACDIIMGQSPPGKTYNKERAGLPFFQGKTDFGAMYPTPATWCTAPKKIAKPNDILISVRAPVGPTNLSNIECCIGRGLAAIRTKDNLFSKYVLYYLRLNEKEIASLGTGSTFQAISKSQIANLEIPLAPFSVQKLIVSEIEKQFSRLDEAVAALKRVRASLKRYKAAVLKAAVEGRLTEKKVKWNATTLGEIISISSGDGLTKMQRNDKGEYLVYGGNGIAGRHSKFMYEEEKLIIGRVGVHCGNAHMTKPKSWITDNAFVVSFDKKSIDIKFLFHLTRFLNLNKYSSSTAQPVISQGKLYPIEISIPEKKEEQQKIVEEIESRLSVAEEIEQTININLKRAERLRQAILKKAFAGKLI